MMWINGYILTVLYGVLRCVINTVHKTQKSPACIPALTPGPDRLERDSGQIIKTHIRYKGEINWKTSRRNLLFKPFYSGSPPRLETELLYSQYAYYLFGILVNIFKVILQYSFSQVYNCFDLVCTKKSITTLADVTSRNNHVVLLVGSQTVYDM